MGEVMFGGDGKRHRRPKPRIAVLSVLLAATLVLPLAAQDRQAMLRALQGGDDFRVRVQAAFAIGNTRDASLRPALERALRDRNPAVRAAAAAALGRLGDPAAARALRRATRDSSNAVRMQAQRSLRTLRTRATRSAPAALPRQTRQGGGFYPAVSVVPTADRIPWPRIRYVVVLGSMSNRTRFRGPFEEQLRNEVHGALRLLRGVAVFPSDNLSREHEREIRRRRLPKLRIDGTLTKIQPRRRRGELSVRAEVNLMLLDDGNIRGMMSGAATGTEPPRANRREQTARLASQALSGAVRSAVSSAPTALARAARH